MTKRSGHVAAIKDGRIIVAEFECWTCKNAKTDVPHTITTLMEREKHLLVGHDVRVREVKP